jgi:hypothetical protein
MLASMRRMCGADERDMGVLLNSGPLTGTKLCAGEMVSMLFRDKFDLGKVIVSTLARVMRHAGGGRL